MKLKHAVVALTVVALAGCYWGDRRDGGRHHRGMISQLMGVLVPAASAGELIIGIEPPPMAIGFYDPQFGYWTGSMWDREWYNEGHGGYYNRDRDNWDRDHRHRHRGEREHRDRDRER